jgi:hypothetical protein
MFVCYDKNVAGDKSLLIRPDEVETSMKRLSSRAKTRGSSAHHSPLPRTAVRNGSRLKAGMTEKRGWDDKKQGRDDQADD